MGSLSGRDFSALLNFLRAVYTVRDLAAFRRQIVSILPELIPSEVTGYDEVDTRKRRTEWVGEPAEVMNFPDSVQIFNQHSHEHPVIAHHTRKNDGQVLKISDFLARARFHDLALYTEFFRRMNVEYQMACVLPAAKPLLIGIALNRRRSDFTERERLLLALLRPHLVQAYQNAAAVTAMKNESASSKRAFARWAQDAIILLPDQRVSIITPAARQLLREYFGSDRGADDLPEVVKQWSQYQRRVLGQLQAPSPLVVRKKDSQLMVRMFFEGDHTVLLLNEQRTAARPESFQAVGLTRREGEVLIWVAQGRTNAEIGVILSLSPRTVQKHLENIFQKLGVENRTAAAIRVQEITGCDSASGR